MRSLPHAEDVAGRRQGFPPTWGDSLQGWFAPDITADSRKGIGRWSIEELVNYLKTGANVHAVATAGMGEEIAHSSSKMTDDDLNAIAIYLKSLVPAQQTAPPALAASDARMVAGQAIYKDTCAPCHTDGGTGSPRLCFRGSSEATLCNPMILRTPSGSSWQDRRVWQRQARRVARDAELRLALQ